MLLKKKYKRLSDEFEDSGFSKYQFEKSKIKIPYKSIGLAFILAFSGLTIFIISLMNLFFNGKDAMNEAFFVISFLGLIMILPGFYHLRIAWCAYNSYDNYSYEDIPDFD